MLLAPPAPSPCASIPLLPCPSPKRTRRRKSGKPTAKKKGPTPSARSAWPPSPTFRQALDQRRATQARQLLASGDGSYTNRAVLRQLPQHTTFVGRIRKDAKLYFPLPPPSVSPARGRRKRYGPPAPTPEQVLHDESIPWQKIPCFAAGQEREIPVKTLRPLYWRKSGPELPLQLLVIKPLGYRLRKGAKLLYRQPAFLVCTDPQLDLKTFLQGYIYRWEIECNHRDEKSLLGVAEGQVRNPQAVARLPQFQVAIYSLLLLASLLAYGFQRTTAYLPLPKWRRQPIRPSLLDLLNLFRQQIFARACPSEPLLVSTTSLLPPHQPRSHRNYLPLPRSSLPSKLNRRAVLATNC